jgi:hypothetical protein
MVRGRTGEGKVWESFGGRDLGMGGGGEGGGVRVRGARAEYRGIVRLEW